MNRLIAADELDSCANLASLRCTRSVARAWGNEVGCESPRYSSISVANCCVAPGLTSVVWRLHVNLANFGIA